MKPLVLESNVHPDVGFCKRDMKGEEDCMQHKVKKASQAANAQTFIISLLNMVRSNVSVGALSKLQCE